jgi:hypothetical protein
VRTLAGAYQVVLHHVVEAAVAARCALDLGRLVCVMCEKHHTQHLCENHRTQHVTTPHAMSP